LQDIAVRIALKSLKRKFEGDRLIQIRGNRSEGSFLSPGVVPFHKPEAIEQPELQGWWGPGTVESFWQSNKVLQITQPSRRTLLFGGSFNPIHNGHLTLARFACERRGFDRVLFIPNGDNYPKSGLAKAEIRLEMVQAAIRGETAYEVLETESRSPVPMRTVQTTEELRAIYPEDELVILRSLDSLPRTHHRLFRIAGLRVLVVHRGEAHSRFEDILRRIPHLGVNRGRIDFVEADQFKFDLSSTEIRNAVRQRRPITDMVPAKVAKIIEDRNLYR
jgi:nicotinate-nucleotide adenylyltransferase